MMGKRKYTGCAIGRILTGSTGCAVIMLFLFVCSAAMARADGEIILLPGERYPIPCLTQLRSDREYDISVDNPDIVGLDETGRCIVAIAVGTTEVTVRLMDTGEAYTYVFAVAEYYGGYQTEGSMTEEHYSEEMRDAGFVEPESIYAEEAHDAGRYDTESPESAKNTESVPAGDMRDVTVSEPVAPEPEETPSVYPEESSVVRVDESQEIFPEGTESLSTEDSSETWESGSEDADESTTAVHTAPVMFTHGTGKYDIMVPPHYTLWICGRSAGPIWVMYVGANGISVPYLKEGNMIYIDSDDLPSGPLCIQVLAADQEGRISAMRGYEVVRAA